MKIFGVSFVLERSRGLKLVEQNWRGRVKMTITKRVICKTRLLVRRELIEECRDIRGMKIVNLLQSVKRRRAKICLKLFRTTSANN